MTFCNGERLVRTLDNLYFLLKQNSSDPEQLELYYVVAVQLWCTIVCNDQGALCDCHTGCPKKVTFRMLLKPKNPNQN